jgi:peptide/nickel transport system substrate-binding protein
MEEKMKQLKWVSVFTIIFALLISACTPKTATPVEPSSTKAPEAPAVTNAPSIVKIGYAGSPDTLNPGTAILSESYVMFELAYSALFGQNLDGTYSKDLLESFEVSSDGKTYTFHIRPNVKFSDGTPLTAKDVVYSFNLYKEHTEFPYMNTYTTNFDTIEAKDDTTVVLTLTEPVPSIEYLTTFLYILPEHIWSQYTGEKVGEFDNKEMIGSGPFILIDYAQGEYIHFKKNPDFYGGSPKVDEVVFQTFKNQDALVQAIKTGQVDMITEMPLTAVASLKNSKDIQLAVGAPLAPDITDIILNEADPAKCPTDGKCTGHPALRDPKVREALAFATNKQEMIDIVLLGLGAAGRTLIPDSLLPWYNDSIQDHPFDLVKANQMLDDAGYKDTDGDGIRQMPDGSHPLSMRLNYPSDSTVAPRLSELLAKTWQQVGVKLEISALDPDALTSACCPSYDYDVLVWGWGSDPDPSFLLSVMTSEGIPSGMNESGYSDKSYDDLYQKQLVEVDPATRKDLVWQMQQKVFNDTVYIIPFYAKAVQAFRTDTFKGWITDQPKLSLDDVTSLMVVELVK